MGGVWGRQMSRRASGPFGPVSLVDTCTYVLKGWRERYPSGPVIAVFDIDWTLAIVDEELVANPGRASQARHQILAARRLLKELDRRGVLIAWVSARTDRPDVHLFTRSQLAEIGLPKPYDVRLCPAELRDSAEKIAKFKYEARRSIEKASGGTVVFTVGDQWADLTRSVWPPKTPSSQWLFTEEGSLIVPGSADGDAVLIKITA